MRNELDLEDIIDELQGVQAYAETLARNVAALRKKLQPVSTGRSKKNVISKAEEAKIIFKRTKNLMRNEKKRSHSN